MKTYRVPALVFRSLDDRRIVFRSLDDRRIVFRSLDDRRIVFRSLDDRRIVYRCVIDSPNNISDFEIKVFHFQTSCPSQARNLSLTKNRFMQDAPKALWSIPYVSVAFFPSLKHNFIAYRSSKMSDCSFEIHQLWLSGFSRVFSNSDHSERYELPYPSPSNGLNRIIIVFYKNDFGIK